MLIAELPRAQNQGSFDLRLEQVPVSSHQATRPRLDQAVDELHVLRIPADSACRRAGVNQLAIAGKKVEEGLAVDLREFPGEFNQHALVFFNDGWRIDNPDTAIPPRPQNSVRWSGEENARHKNVCIEDDSHRSPRTLAIARFTCRAVRPAERAWRRASRINVSNCSHDGEGTRWNTSTSSLATTTNSTPGSSRSCARIRSGITTCPREDILVVTGFIILPIRL